VTAVYLGAFAVGAIAVLSALLLAEFSIGGGHGPDGLPFVSLTSLSAALLGAGAGGLIGTWAGLGGAVSGVISAVSAVVLLLGLQGLVLPYLRRQESNSHRGRISYIGLLGTVTLEVPADGWGEVAFVDADGNRVRSRAVTTEPHALAKATQVYISDVDADVVHVVSIEGALPPHNPAPERP
jgi:membrane protein implicated in regulation of membrane protease activity